MPETLWKTKTSRMVIVVNPYKTKPYDAFLRHGSKVRTERKQTVQGVACRLVLTAGITRTFFPIRFVFDKRSRAAAIGRQRYYRTERFARKTP